MGIFEGVILCSDIDGTLIGEKVMDLTKKPRISEQNREAIRFFEEEGGRFIISTGRFASFVREELDFISHSPLICVNGTLIYDEQTQKVLKILPMSDPDIRLSEEFYLRYLPVILEAHIHCLKETLVVKTEEEFDAALKKVQSETGVLKVVYVFKDEASAVQAQTEFLKEQKFQVCLERSWPFGVEIHGGDSGKDVCMKFLKDLYGAHIAAAVGDFENDLAMLKSADISYATGNALDTVKEASDITTPPCWEHAVAWVIQDLKNKMTVQA